MNVHSSEITVSLGEVAAINPKGPRPGELASNEPCDFLPMALLSEDGTTRIEEQRPYSDVAKTYTPFKHGDVLVAKITPCFENNKIAVASIVSDWAFGSTEFHVIRPSECLDGRYLAYFLRQDAVRTTGEKRMTGSGGQRRVPKTFLEELRLPLPPLAEQKRVAAILDQADALRRLRRRALDRLNTLGPAIFQEMFGEFRSSTGDWNLVRLGDAVKDAKIGLVRGAHQMGDELATPYLRMDSIGNDGSLRLSGLKNVSVDQRELDDFNLERGDLLFNTRNSRELVGKTAVVRNEFSGVYNNNILRCRFTAHMTADFIDSYFRTHHGSNMLESIKSGTTSVFAIYQKNLMQLLVPCPPKGVQIIYSKRLSELNTRMAVQIRSTERCDSLFTSLQHRAFRGEL